MEEINYRGNYSLDENYRCPVLKCDFWFLCKLFIGYLENWHFHYGVGKSFSNGNAIHCKRPNIDKSEYLIHHQKKSKLSILCSWSLNKQISCSIAVRQSLLLEGQDHNTYMSCSGIWWLGWGWGCLVLAQKP